MEEYGNMLIIANNEQFLPYCQINFTKMPAKRTAQEEAAAAEAQKRRIVIPKGATFGPMLPSSSGPATVGTMGPSGSGPMITSGSVGTMGPSGYDPLMAVRLAQSGFNVGPAPVGSNMGTMGPAMAGLGIGPVGTMGTSGPSTSGQMGLMESKRERIRQLRKDMVCVSVFSIFVALISWYL